MKNFILCCIDNESFAESVCDYGVYIANNAKLPLLFLNVIEKEHSKKKVDLSGNLSLGERDDLLEELTEEESKLSHSKIATAKALLEKLKNRALQTCEQEVQTKQYHGDIVEIILDFKESARMLIVGLNSSKTQSIGDNVISIIKQSQKPVLLVNSNFSLPQKILLDYNRSQEALKLLNDMAKSPLFGAIERHIINVNSDEKESLALLEEAKNIFAAQGHEVTTKYLQGNPQEEIIKYFEKSNFDILARGAFTQSALKEFFLGSVTDKILSSMKRPVLLLK